MKILKIKSLKMGVEKISMIKYSLILIIIKILQQINRGVKANCCKDKYID